jgi:NADPH-dependent curcumin reductase CurA
MTGTCQRIVLASRPRGAVVPENFRLETVTAPDANSLAEGQVLVANHYLSLDPYMRGRMSAAKSYAPSQPLGETMLGGGAGVVVASRHPQFAEGDSVTGLFGWAEMALVDGKALRKVDSEVLPLSVYLGAAGMPGMAAWYGVNEILLPKAGETVLVTAASGAVGAVVGQLARLRGCRVVGIAGGPAKCAYVRGTLAFDACIDYKAADWVAELAAATPDGIDAIFENVGGAVYDAALARTNAFGRIALCGWIAGYNGEDIALRNSRYLLTNRLSVRGFVITEQMEYWPQGLAELAALIASGKLLYRESVVEGLAAAPAAFIGLLNGKNFGKQLVKLVP